MFNSIIVTEVTDYITFSQQTSIYKHPKNPTPTPCILKNYDSDSNNFSEVPDSDYQKHSVINSKAITHRLFLFIRFKYMYNIQYSS